jgi:restriction endonuclease S subunit
MIFAPGRLYAPLGSDLPHRTIGVGERINTNVREPEVFNRNPFDTFAINEHFYRLRAKPEFGQTLLYFWLSSDCAMDEMRIKGTGVAIPRLNSKQVKSLTTQVPASGVAKAFDMFVEPMISRI